ncbi:hypothetical protein Afil01_15230 [Actinorhabdospora filicis]|uniref:Nucleoside phosphorylase domain-containing protein n=1 Tax=Actinorhabdospora filicis TaxID=1785913 RepID=A0A9W6W8Q2_9ACTN|nr:phosphorylase [Actinorhabdospora filicis]GLZ76716.1 hypothetical protein Afil01_15230 [Actinorhabdospora filicis]
MAVLCAALPLEYGAVRDLSPGPVSREELGGVHYETSSLGGWKVVLAFIGRENTAAAIQVQRMITALDPQVAMLVGIAGGRYVSHGDVIAADCVYDYEAGRDDDEGSYSRVKSLHSAAGLVAIAQTVAIDAAWPGRLAQPPDPMPRAYVAPLASGGKVVTGSGSHTARLIERRCDDARGVETEGFGFLAAVRANDGVDGIVLRGVSDLLGDKTSDGDRVWQPRAARHAAAFAFELLSRTEPRPVTPRESGEPVMVNNGIENSGGGNAHLGIGGQGNSGNTVGTVGTSHGDVRIEWTPLAPTELDELRVAIKRLLALLSTHAGAIAGRDAEYEHAVRELETSVRGGRPESGRVLAALRSIGSFAAALTGVRQAIEAVQTLINAK